MKRKRYTEPQIVFARSVRRARRSVPPRWIGPLYFSPSAGELDVVACTVLAEDLQDCLPRIC